MSTLLLRLAGPMQSWGNRSRFARRDTAPAPTKSGVVGLLAAARGLRRSDPLEDLLTLNFGVRIDQPGRVERDFQTARTADGGHSFPLTDRYYLADAVFVAAVAGNDVLIDGLADAVGRPTFPLYLGRRAFPPVGPLALGVREESLWDSLQSVPWQAAEWHRRRQGPVVHLEMRVDTAAVPDGLDEVEQPHSSIEHRDDPVSFDPRRRVWRERRIDIAQVRVENTDAVSARAHDPMALLGGA